MELFGFGPHLMIDGYHANPEKLADLVLVAQLLADLPLELHMQPIMAPQVQQLDGLSPEGRGLSGVVLVAESHIAIHTFPERGFLSVDIFSCREFDVQQALAVLVERFDVGRFETHFINRGKEFPKDIAGAQRIVAGEREYLEARIA